MATVLQSADLTPGQEMPDPDSIIHTEPIKLDPPTLRVFYYTEASDDDGGGTTGE
jgi:hypothetical protein